jgi:hypothetical protein
MLHLSRRAFLGKAANGLGHVALSSLLLRSAARAAAPAASHGIPDAFRAFAPKAKRVIYLFQSGGPSHVDLFDGKPALDKLHGSNLPDSVRGGQRVTGMTSGQASFPVVRPIAGGKSAARRRLDLRPAAIHPENRRRNLRDPLDAHRGDQPRSRHHPDQHRIHATRQRLRRAWVSYGLGTDNANLPAYMVLVSQGTGKNPGQPIFSRLWGSGFLPSQHQGVMLRAGAEPVLYLDNPGGVSRPQRRHLLDDLATLNQRFAEEVATPKPSPASMPTKWPSACRPPSPN